jgi:hypothetical protein
MKVYEVKWECKECGNRIKENGVFNKKGKNYFFKEVFKCGCGNRRNFEFLDMKIKEIFFN